MPENSKLRAWLEKAREKGEKALKIVLCALVAAFTSFLLYPLFPLKKHTSCAPFFFRNDFARQEWWLHHHVDYRSCILEHLPLFLVIGIGFAVWLYRRT